MAPGPEHSRTRQYSTESACLSTDHPPLSRYPSEDRTAFDCFSSRGEDVVERSKALPRQCFERVGAGSRKGREWRASGIFVSIRRFDPTPSFWTAGPRGPVQSDHIPPMRGVFVPCGLVVAVDRPQNRHGSTRLTVVNGGDPYGGNRRGLTARCTRNPLYDKWLRRMSAGRSAAIGPDWGENYWKLTRAGRLEGVARLSGQIPANSG